MKYWLHDSGGNDAETEEIYAFFRNAVISSAKLLWSFYTLRVGKTVIMAFAGSCPQFAVGFTVRNFFPQDSYFWKLVQINVC